MVGSDIISIIKGIHPSQILHCYYSLPLENESGFPALM